MFIYFIVFFLVFWLALFFYKARKVKWNESLLSAGEKVLYEQTKTTLYTIAGKGKRGMAWLFVKMTPGRIFFLYPDKKRITTVFNFTAKKEKEGGVDILKDITIYLDKKNVKISMDELGRTSVHIQGENVHYEFRIRDEKKVKEILSL